MSQPLATVSLDLDDAWAYLRTRGEPIWASLPTYLDVLIPRALAVFAALDLKITFFVVGTDAARPQHRGVMASMGQAGHEIGNHSLNHLPWMHRLPLSEIQTEVARAEEHITEACGIRPVGFRGPGYSVGPQLLEVLADRDYLFDASTLPTWIGPLARAYYFRETKLSPTQKNERAELFGHFGEAKRALRPYRWRLDDGRTMLEMPVTTMPGARTPFHMSYLLFLASRSERLMHTYLQAALMACSLTQTPINFLLHPLDLLGGDESPALKFFPAMGMDGATKRRLLMQVLRTLGAHSRLVPMGQMAQKLSGRSLRTRTVKGAFR